MSKIMLFSPTPRYNVPVVTHERPKQRSTMLNCWVRLGDFEQARRQLNRVFKR